MSNQRSDEIAAHLARVDGVSASAAQIAASIASTCRGVEEALTPIIGARGVAALFDRSLHVTCQSFPWLGEAKVGVSPVMALDALASLLVRQDPLVAAAAGGLFLHTFHQVLSSLIGASLTERLLRSAWVPFLSSTPRDKQP